VRNRREALGSEPRPMTAACIRDAVRAASQAPSVHNTQPWRFHWDGRYLSIWPDWSRQLPVLDPSGRQLAISCGAALGHAVVALRPAGRDPRVTLADGLGQGGPFAILDTEPGLAPAGVQQAAALFAAVRHRRSIRDARAPEAVPPSLSYALVGAAAAEGATLTPVTEPGRRRDVQALIARADTAQRSDPSYRAELHDWSRPPVKRGWTASRAAPPPARRDPAVPNRFIRPLPGDGRPLAPGQAAADPARGDGPSPPAAAPSPLAAAPSLLALSTREDRMTDWLVAGRALSTVLLVATNLGLGVMLANQPVDSEAFREAVARSAGVPGFAHAVLVVGYPAARSGPRSPRQDVDTLFTDGSAPGAAAAAGGGPAGQQAYPAAGSSARGAEAT